MSGRRYNTTRRPKRRRSKYTEAERLAFKIGRIEAGLDNPDSKVAESYANGVKSIQQGKARQKKTLY